MKATLRLIGLTLLTLVVNGYHPYAEDAGIYAAGVRLQMNPGMYGFSAGFIRPYLHLSLFYLWNALLVRSLHLSLGSVFFASQVATTGLLLYACWQLALRCFDDESAAWGAVTVFALCLPVPVAGTSFYLMDPYLTSRSITMPLTVLAICACMDRRWLTTTLLLALALLFHPLMSIYGIGFVLLLVAVQQRSRLGVCLLALLALGLGAALQFSQRNVVETAAYRAAIVSRYYCFIPMWHWYEWIGLIAPVVLAAIYIWWRRFDLGRPDVVLAVTAAAMAVIATTVSLLYAHRDGHSHLIARLQTLRALLLVYDCMFLLLGGVVARLWLKRVLWRWAVLIGVLAATLYGVQRATYPASSQVELPWVVQSNPWTEAFLWIRAHTTEDAIVAMDSDYIQADGEDAQGFRAIAERSSLADFSKDGGTAAIFPELADRWMVEHTAQTGLSRMTDGERRRRLAPYPVEWLVLEADASTAYACPYRNADVKVCAFR